MSRTRNFCFTINNYTPEHEQLLKDIECKWVVYGRETAPTTGTPHLQCAIVFSEPCTLSACVKRIPGANVEICKGSPAQNREYCCKEDKEFYERGTCPATSKEKGQKEKQRWADALLAVHEDRLVDVCPQIIATKLKSVEYGAQRLYGKRKVSALESLDNEWHYGDPESGKSEYARSLPNSYVKLAHAKWWDDYDGEEVVVIDDFSDPKLVDEMISFADLYPVRVEKKNGSFLVRPRRVIVTSQARPGSYCGDPVRATALERRFKLVHHVHDPNYSGAPGTGDERGANSNLNEVN